MTEHFIEDSQQNYRRRVWLLDSSAPGLHHAAVFLDGEFYVERMDAPAVLRDLQSRGELPAMPCLFVSHADSAARHADLTCNAAYAEFIVHTVMGWLRARVPALAEGGHLIVGPSLGGLQAAFIALEHPQVFTRCLSQSGSFWWENERLTARLPELPPAHAPSRFWISVGDRETQKGISHAPSGLRQDIPQIDGCERFAQALAARGHDVRYSIHPGAHELQPWAAELPRALGWLLRR